MKEHIAIIDIGSNTVRLVIYEIQQTSFQEIENIKAPIRLGSYISDENEMLQEGMDKLLQVLHSFREVIDSYAVQEVQCMATAAIRAASNRETIRKHIYEQTRFSISILSGEEEARYGCIAVTETLPLNNGLSIDLGGASTEVALFQNRQMIQCYSFPFGAVTIKNRFIQGNGITMEEKSRLETFLLEQFASQPWIKQKGGEIAGIGGSARNLANIDQLNRHYPPLGLHGYEMSKSSIETLRSTLVDLTYEELERVDGLSKERIDLISPAIEVFHSLFLYSEANKLITSSRGLRDGIVLERYAKCVLKDEKNVHDELALQHMVKERGTVRLLDRYAVNKQQSEQRTKLALQLLGDLQQIGLIQFTKEEIFWIRQASLLFYSGEYISKRVRGQNTFYLITNSIVDGYTHKEKVMLAIMASFTNYSTFKQCIEPYKHWFVDKEIQQMRIIGALLKLCFSFNSTKRNVVDKIHAHQTDRELILEIQCSKNCLAEQYQSEKQKKHLANALQIPIQLQF